MCIRDSHGGDLGREIAFPIKRDTEEIWKEKLLRVDCGWEIWEEDSLLPVMQIGEVPLRSCISYRNGPNCDCLLSCFEDVYKRQGQCLGWCGLRAY